MVTINLSYYSMELNGTQTEWFKLVSGSYTSECRLRTGDEDLRVIDLFLEFTKPSIVNINFPEDGMDENKKSRLEGRVEKYFSGVVQKTLKN